MEEAHLISVPIPASAEINSTPEVALYVGGASFSCQRDKGTDSVEETPDTDYGEDLEEELKYLEKCPRPECLSNGKTIMVIYTGGTVGMQRDPKTGSFSPQPNFLERVVRNFRQFNNRSMPVVEFFSFSPPLDSSDVSQVHWELIAEVVEENMKREHISGFVVLHGTDTLAYSASALSFALDGLDRPVVFTGSQMPLITVRSDGLRNLVDAFLVACHAPIPEVLVVFDGHILRGNRTTKHSSFGTSAFVSHNFPELGGAGIKLWYHPRFIHTNSKGDRGQGCHIPTVTKPHFGDCSPVTIIQCYPGCYAHIPSFLRSLGGDVRGVVFQAFGSGNAPSDTGLLDALREVSDRGVVVVVLSLCAKGSVVLDIYNNGLTLKKMGLVSGFDMTLEAAYTKLSWLLARGLTIPQVKKAMESNLRGELTTWSGPADVLAPGRAVIA